MTNSTMYYDSRSTKISHDLQNRINSTMKSFKQVANNEVNLDVKLTYPLYENFIGEAYSFFPKSEEEIKTQLSKWPDDSINDAIKLLNYLKSKHDTPINIDMNIPKRINVVRALKDDFTNIGSIASSAGITNVKIKYGNGSMGGRGINNKGKDFEDKFAGDVERWYKGEELDKIPEENLKAILQCDKLYDWSNSKTFKVSVDASANTPRPISFGSKIELTNTKGSGFDLGKAVTDITVTSDGTPTYLSMKSTGTVTFFNVGVRTKLTPSEIQTGKIKNTDGLKLLKMFGIDPVRFCTIFNDDVKSDSGKVNVRANPAVTHLLQSGIGYNYHVLHKKGGKVYSYKMSETLMKKAAKVGSMTIHYGGMRGKGKRVDMTMESPLYYFKLNIRDTQGADGYPTRMMCDFKAK